MAVGTKKDKKLFGNDNGKLTTRKKSNIKNNCLYQMDCFDYLRLLPDESVDLIVSDPPYEVSFSGNKYYDDSYEYLKHNIDKWFAEMSRVLKTGHHIYIYAPSRNLDVFIAVCKKYFYYDCPLTAPIKASCLEPEGTYKHDSQYVIHASKGSPIAFNEVDIQRKSSTWLSDPQNKDPNQFSYHYSSILTKRSNAEKKVHPNSKNIEQIKEFILLTTQEGEVVLDPFTGGQSTAKAARETGRDYYTCDINAYSVLDPFCGSSNFLSIIAKCA